MQPALQWHGGSKDVTVSGQDSSKGSLQAGVSAHGDAPAQDQFLGGVLASLDTPGHDNYGSTARASSAEPAVHNAAPSTAPNPGEVTNLADNDLSSDGLSIQGWRSPTSG